jgi:D-serine deaminase-like pyridoxal phosphate-dependent protein
MAQKETDNWYVIDNVGGVNSPALLVYPDRVKSNIQAAIEMTGGADRLRPHVKTHKMASVCQLMINAGICKFKCATIAEAEMLAHEGAPDVLLAYQPVGPAISRFICLIQLFSTTRFSCLVDNEASLEAIAQKAEQSSVVVNLFIDLNVGMNRTGVKPERALHLIEKIHSCEHVKLLGIHAYDGQIHESDPLKRKEEALSCAAQAEQVLKDAEQRCGRKMTLVMGGTPTFPVYAKEKKDCECSPGTFVFWDWGYAHLFPDEPFVYAALLLCRVISIVDDTHITIDLGYKAVSSENPLPRVHFLNAPDAVPVMHSEEHMVLEVPTDNTYYIGDVLYGVPVHICPAVALYDEATVVSEHKAGMTWKVSARGRHILV